MTDQKKMTDILMQIADVMDANREYLTELDNPIGDGDHGINMARGFNEIRKQKEVLETKDAGSLLKTAGMTLVSKVGGSAGPLYGTFFMKAGNAIGKKNEIDIHDFLVGMQAGIEGVKMRGKSDAGEKTMLDAMIPALEAMQAAEAAGDTPGQILKKGTAAAKAGMEATIPMQATKGRASYLQERSIGHQDPGATSFYLMMDVLNRSEA